MPGQRSPRRGSTIGLEIGSRYVRAAEVKSPRGKPLLRHYAQVDLPDGAVIDGEVADPAVVGRALKELWAKGHFSHHRVVVGVSSRRVVVREADLPAMKEDDLRSALQFEAENLIPIPVEDAVLDFSTVDVALPNADPSAPGQIRILLAAAQRDMVKGHMAALAAGGLRPVAVDPAALALLRSIPSRQPNQTGTGTGALTEALVAVGDTVTTLAIREGGVPRFVRVLNVGADAIGPSAPTTSDQPEASIESQLSSLIAAATMTATLPAVAGPMRALIDDIRGSLDFFLAKGDVHRVDRIVVTGDGDLIDALVKGLHSTLGQPIERADPLATVGTGNTGLTGDQISAAAPYLVVPIGLALWGSTPGRPISLMLPETIRAARERRQAVFAGCAVMLLVAALVLMWALRGGQVTSAQSNAKRVDTRVAALQARLVVLNRGSALKTQVAARQHLYTLAVAGEVDWTRLLYQVTAAMPPDVHLTSIAFSAPVVPTAASAVAASGSITVQAVGTNGPASVNAWIRAMGTVPSLTGLWVQTITTSSPTSLAVTFGSSASLTQEAYSKRSISGVAGS